MSVGSQRWIRRFAVVLCGCLALSGCATVVNGEPTVQAVPAAHLDVKGTDNGPFDMTVKNALSDIIAFWKKEYPKISGGKSLTPLKGGFYSVDGLKVALTRQLTGPVQHNWCAQRDIAFVVDNGAFCQGDDSISWDRSPTHLFAQLGKKYGALTVAMIFAHEYGHAISYRQGVFNQHLPTIDTESQADCAAGAWAASALKGQDPHFRDTTLASLDDAMEGFLDGRDATPDTPEDVSHGNGFDRLSAVADGINKGVTYCFSSGYFSSRQFTERPFTSQSDYEAGGNEPLSNVLAPSAGNDFVADLNRYWTAAAQSINKTFRPVSIAAASHPPCAASNIKFGYCTNTNTVYYEPNFAKSAYYSLPQAVAEPGAGANVKLLNNQPADFSLGTLFAIGWGMAVRHQLFNRTVQGSDALQAAICYTGAYAKDINIDSNSPEAQSKKIILSPADLDEASSAMLTQVDKPGSFGAQGTTGLDRIQDFVKGYHHGLPACSGNG